MNYVAHDCRNSRLSERNKNYCNYMSEKEKLSRQKNLSQRRNKNIYSA